ncbi:MAG: MafI family immunity protein [Acidobacteria bacterium]|nr:MafI family immunity protein [Acidobacteriota bacterium]
MFKFIRRLFYYVQADKNLKEATALVAESLIQAGYPERVQDVYDNIEHNESGLALENLCENLYDFSCPVPQKAYDLLERSGLAMDVDKDYWERLKPLIVK